MNGIFPSFYIRTRVLLFEKKIFSFTLLYKLIRNNIELLYVIILKKKKDYK